MRRERICFYENGFQHDSHNGRNIRDDLYEKVTGQIPELNFLINNAGIMNKVNFHDKDVDLEDIGREIEINLSGSIRNIKVFELAPPVVKTPLIDAFDSHDIEGVKPMHVGEMVRDAIMGLERDRLEILPGVEQYTKVHESGCEHFIKFPFDYAY